MEIVHQLGELFLEAVPTVLIVFVFYLFLRANLFKPLLRVMAERRERTVGAQEAAQASQAAAAEKVRAYQEALKKARGEIYAQQEAVRQKMLEGRTARIREARESAAIEVRTAKQRISREVTAARADLETASALLGGEIARAILERRPPQPARATR